MGRTFEYANHCIFKHSTGSMSIREFLAKVSRVYTELLRAKKLKPEDKDKIERMSLKLSEILNNLKKISTKLIKGDISTIEKYLITMATISVIRAELEQILKEWIDLLRKYHYKEKDIDTHIEELLPLLGDLYKIEQDHLPELLEVVGNVEFRAKKLKEDNVIINNDASDR